MHESHRMPYPTPPRHHQCTPADTHREWLGVRVVCLNTVGGESRGPKTGICGFSFLREKHVKYCQNRGVGKCCGPKTGGEGSLEVSNRSTAGPGKGPRNAQMRELDAQMNGAPTPNTSRATEHLEKTSSPPPPPFPLPPFPHPHPHPHPHPRRQQKSPAREQTN
jgi:hypothetical protein